MRFSTKFGFLVLAVVQLLPAGASGQGAPDAYQIARINARRALEMAKIELRLYYQVEYPRQQRHLDAQIKLTDAEVRIYKERLREYEPFDRFRSGRPLLTTIQDLRLCLLEAELRLRDLREERIALTRYHSDHWRLLELKVQDARIRVAELERDDDVAAQ